MGGQDDNADELRPLRASGALRLDERLPWRARLGLSDDDDDDGEEEE
jgi:hypothetical protein